MFNASESVGDSPCAERAEIASSPGKLSRHAVGETPTRAASAKPNRADVLARCAEDDVTWPDLLNSFGSTPYRNADNLIHRRFGPEPGG